MPGITPNRHIHGLLADMGVDPSSTALAPSSPLSNGEAKGVKKAEKKKSKEVGESGDVAKVIDGSEGKTVAKGVKRKKETVGEGTPGKAEKSVVTNGDATPDAKQKKKKEKKGKDEEVVDGEKKKKKKAKREESSDGEKESGGGSGEETSDAEENPMALKNFGISENVKRALEAKGIKALFPIQAQTFNIVMDGSDLVARARTGQGKTLAFVLPILERLLAETNGESQKAYGRPPRVIVLAPTRELAKQVGADFEVLGESVRLSTVCVYGGAPMGPQESKLRRGVDVVVGTPGRVKDLLQRNTLSLKSLRFRVLDEADEMLNMGFVDDVETILGAADASTVQTLLFSATIPAWVNEISKRFLKPQKKTVDLVGDEKLKASASVRHLMLPCHWTQRCQVVTDLISCYSRGGRVIVFTETKNDATALAEGLAHAGARALHGDIPQNQREATLAGFRAGTFKVLVATDVAARGLDINDVQLVVQCSPPQTEETYIHRSGRTGRAGATGISVILTGGKKDYMIDIIQRKAGVKFERIAVPQPADIARSSASNAADSVREVGNSVIPLFREAAEQLLEQSDVPPADLLAKALARIAGHSELKRRSLLTAHDDATTLLFRASTSIRTPTYVFSMLRRLLPEDVVNSVRRMSLTADCSGAVFDVPSAAAQQFVDAFANEGNTEDGHATVTLEIAEKLPELQAKPETRGSPGGSRFGSGGFSRGRGGSSPGGFGGRGSRSPGHGGRGGGRGRGGGGRGRR